MIDLTDLPYEYGQEAEALRLIFDVPDANARVYPKMTPIPFTVKD